MRKIRGFVIAIIIMLIVSVMSLLVVTVLTYLFKWQADKAMIGIIVTYILAGFAGGMSLKWVAPKEYHGEKTMGRKKGLEAWILANSFMLILLCVSIFVAQSPFEFSGRFLMIWSLLISSTFLGRIL
ncbi:MAG: hypothetical protein IJ455_07345 [Agathobacter sp.]|nr:hypothetical protein [Agathobacter sp.]